jgi:hypothetical protein
MIFLITSPHLLRISDFPLSTHVERGIKGERF